MYTMLFPRLNIVYLFSKQQWTFFLYCEGVLFCTLCKEYVVFLIFYFKVNMFFKFFLFWLKKEKLSKKYILFRMFSGVTYIYVKEKLKIFPTCWIFKEFPFYWFFSFFFCIFFFLQCSVDWLIALIYTLWIFFFWVKIDWPCASFRLVFLFKKVIREIPWRILLLIFCFLFNF